MVLPEEVERRAVTYTAAVLRVLAKGFDEQGVRIETIHGQPPEPVWLKGTLSGVKVRLNAWLNGEFLNYSNIHTRINAPVSDTAVEDEERVRQWLIDSVKLEYRTKFGKPEEEK